MGKICLKAGLLFFPVFTPPKLIVQEPFLFFYLLLFDLVAKIIFLSVKNIGGTFVPLSRAV